MELTSDDIKELGKEVKDLKKMKREIVKFCGALVLNVLDKQKSDVILNAKKVKLNFTIQLKT